MTRRPSLAGRLSRALAACVALALIVMVAVSTLVMRSWMLADLDSELARLSQRVAERLQLEDESDEDAQSDSPDDEAGNSGDGADSDDDAESSDQSEDQPSPPAPPLARGERGPGFGGSGISEGTLQYVDEDGEVAGAIVSNFSVRPLDEHALAVLGDVPVDGIARTVRLKSWGSFRVRAQVYDGRTVLVGVPMDRVEDVVLMLVAVEVGLSLVVAIASGVAGRAWVRRGLGHRAPRLGGGSRGSHARG